MMNKEMDIDVKERIRRNNKHTKKEPVFTDINAKTVH